MRITGIVFLPLKTSTTRSYPSCLQTTAASVMLHPSSHTVPHESPKNTSTLPSDGDLPPTSRTLSAWALSGEGGREREREGGREESMYYYHSQKSHAEVTCNGPHIPHTKSHTPHLHTPHQHHCCGSCKLPTPPPSPSGYTASPPPPPHCTPHDLTTPSPLPLRRTNQPSRQLQA